MTTNFPTSADTVASLRPVGADVIQEYQMSDNIAAATVAVENYLLSGAGVGSPTDGLRIARGIHVQVAAEDTVDTGLATVVACVAQFQDPPTVNQLFCEADVGDQAGAPAAGSVLIRTYKPTAVNDVTPTAATDFTDDLAIAWVAIGT